VSQLLVARTRHLDPSGRERLLTSRAIDFTAPMATTMAMIAAIPLMVPTMNVVQSRLSLITSTCGTAREITRSG
jgi:hypothetical protein